jgi:NADH-quinone oxidoreductase subunit C
MDNENQFPIGFEERAANAGGTILPPAADDIPAVRVDAENLIALITSLRDGPGARFDMLIDVFSVDEHPASPRFDVIYHLRRLETGEIVRIKAFAEGKKHEIPSVTALYPTANWHEREAYDMMGITFTGHPDPRRILMSHEFEYFPLRKDFPLEGIEPDRLFNERFPEKSIGSMHQKLPGEEHSGS